MRAGRRWWTGLPLLLIACSPLGHAVELIPGMAPLLIDQVQAVADNAATPPADSADWQAATLPDRWSLTRPDYEGTVWYRVTARVGSAPTDSWSLMLPKLSMNADVWINGVLMGRIGRMDEPLTRHWNQPLLFPIPLTAWQAGDNRVQVRVKAYDGHDGGLGRVWIGPAEAVADIFRGQDFWQSTLVSIADISLFALGLFFLFIWARKRQDVYFGYFAFGALFWGLANSNMALTDPPLPDNAWEWLTHVSMLWGGLLLGLFGLRWSGKSLARTEPLIFAFGLLAAVIFAAAPERWRGQTAVALMLPVLVVGGAGMLAAIGTLRLRPWYDILQFAAASVATIGIGIHDWLLRGGYLPYESAYALPFAVPLLLSSMAWLVAGDFARAQRDLAQLNQDLATRVDERENQLRETYARLGESERERAVVAERARILRDMHDGVGAHLSAAIRQIEAGQASSDEVAQSLRDSLDQLKLSVDAMTLPPGDVNALLAAMRYRLQPRIQAAGLSLEWQVELLPPWQSDSSTAMRHLQYMLFEAFSNALQHARAKTLKLSAQLVDATRIVVALGDDGQGFQVAPEKALRSLRERARLIGAELIVETGKTGSCVRVVLPLR